MKNVNNLRGFLREGDIFVVDRGFRDCLDYLHELGLETKMPYFLNKSQPQHTTEEANESRIVTSIR